MLGPQAAHSKGGGAGTRAAMRERLKQLLRRVRQNVEGQDESAAAASTTPEAELYHSMASSAVDPGWAVGESIEWLVQQARAADGLPPGSEDVLRLLESPALRAVARALEQLADITPSEETAAGYGRLCSALDAAASALGSVQSDGVFARRRQRRLVQAACTALQPLCDLGLESSVQLQLQAALQRLPLKCARASADAPPPALSRDSGTAGCRWGGRLNLLKPRLPSQVYQHGADLVPRIDEALKTTRNIGIVGGMGSGKTTVADAVFDRVASRFDAALWPTVPASSHANNLSKAAWVLFPDFQPRMFACPSEGAKYISERLVKEGSSVLLVLDDASPAGASAADLASVKALNFATLPGMRVDSSRLIITARDRKALDLPQLRSTDSTACSTVGGLTELHVFSSRLDEISAQEMLYSHAFGRSDAPPPAYVPSDTCARLLKDCCGLPFALQVLGSALRHCSSSEEWEAVRAAGQRPSVRGCQATVKACAASIAILPPSLQRSLAAIEALPGGNIAEAEVAHACAALAPLYTPASVQAARRKIEQLVRRGLLSVRPARTRRIYHMHDAVRESLRVLGMTCPSALSQLQVHRAEVFSGPPGKARTAVVQAEIVAEAYAAHTRSVHSTPRTATWCTNAPLSALAWWVIGSSLPEPLLKRLRAIRGFGAAEMRMLDCLAGSVHLDLSGCKHLVQLPESIGRQAVLGRLALSGCTRLACLPEGISSCLRLLHIDLSGCHSLSQLPESVGGCIQLEELNLQQCSSLAQLPESIGGCSELADLNLQGCSSLAVLPESLGGCSGLKALDLSHCEQVVSLPESIGRLTRMTHLSLHRCSRLAHVPGSIGKCAKLRFLDLSHCSSLAQLPDGVSRCTTLEGLSVMHCTALEHLPPGIARLPELRRLHLHGCSHSVRHADLPPVLAAAAAFPASSLANPPFGRVTTAWTHELHVNFVGRDRNQELGNTAVETIIKSYMLKSTS